MARYLKTNTATRITVGPFLDKTDGITPEVALTATNEHLTLMVDTAGVPTLVLDANATASGGNNDMVHVTNDDAGFYDLELTAAQTNYVGNAMLSVNYVTDHLPVFHEFIILSAQAYDAMCGTGLFFADVVAISTDTTAADNCELMFDGTGYAGGTAKLKVDLETIKTQAVTCAAGVTVPTSIASPTNITAGVITTTTNLTNLPSIPAGWVTAAGIADAAIDFATFATDCKTGTGLKANVESISANAITATSINTAAITNAKFAAGAIDAASIANGAIDNATFAADVGSTTFATNIIGQAVFKALDSAIGDAVSLTSNSLLDKMRTASWILRNKIAVTDATGSTVIYKDDSTTAAFTVANMLTDDSTTTTRLRVE